jgi:hypothetical protein
MKEQTIDEVVARRFLLGQLSPDEQGRVEELAFDDPESFEVLQAAEDDLIDEFVYDDLSSEEKERFEEYYLVQPGRREDLRMASALREHFERAQPVPSVWERVKKWFHLGTAPLIPIVVKAAIIIGAAVVTLVTLIPRMPRLFPVYQVKQGEPPALPSPTTTVSQTPSQPSQPSPSPAPKASPTPHRPTSTSYAFLLVPGGPARTGGGGEKSVPLGSGSAEFELPLTGDTSYQNYQAILLNGDKVIQTFPRLKPTKISTGKGIRIRLPANLLEASQRYHFVLKGVAANGSLELVDNYYFHVTK